ncbi:hypothetical protein BDY19DRAFT_61209 [Irpex rosettiformis]|uniref:Uncharacterized protein n=1 Tax=Irpex rosettiformis TaxID=378272 RepID=A0ACB8UKY9_9APHY|nr:hypothetical protein BDY19DRAFT_61209 [Irpex rosettiformis]
MFTPLVVFITATVIFACILISTLCNDSSESYIINGIKFDILLNVARSSLYSILESSCRPSPTTATTVNPRQSLANPRQPPSARHYWVRKTVVTKLISTGYGRPVSANAEKTTVREICLQLANSHCCPTLLDQALVFQRYQLFSLSLILEARLPIPTNSNIHTLVVSADALASSQYSTRAARDRLSYILAANISLNIGCAPFLRPPAIVSTCARPLGSSIHLPNQWLFV